jgi:hypothetical protein
MNLFAVDWCPERAAQALCNQHVVKMPLETAQILCTVSALLGRPGPYKPTHAQHPCTRWVMRTIGNWRWAADHGYALCAEYTRRYGKRHASQDVLDWCCSRAAAVPGTCDGLLPFVQAMPEQYQGPDPVESYRAYYRAEKLKFGKWAPRAQVPEWLHA